MPPPIPFWCDRNRFFRPAHDQDMLHTRDRSPRQRLIHLSFERHDRIFAPPTICRNHQLGFSTDQPIFQGFSTKSTKDNRVNRTDPSTSQHCNRCFWDHRHIDPNPIAFLDPQLLQSIGKLTNLSMQLDIGQDPAISRFSFPDQGRVIAAVSFEVTIQTVVGNIDLPSDKPLGLGRIPSQNPIPSSKPMQLLLSESCPKGFRIVSGFLAKNLIRF